MNCCVLGRQWERRTNSEVQPTFNKWLCPKSSWKWHHNTEEVWYKTVGFIYFLIFNWCWTKRCANFRHNYVPFTEQQRDRQTWRYAVFGIMSKAAYWSHRYTVFGDVKDSILTTLLQWYNIIYTQSREMLKLPFCHSCEWSYPVRLDQTVVPRRRGHLVLAYVKDSVLITLL